MTRSTARGGIRGELRTRAQRGRLIWYSNLDKHNSSRCAYSSRAVTVWECVSHWVVHVMRRQMISTCNEEHVDALDRYGNGSCPVLFSTLKPHACVLTGAAGQPSPLVGQVASLIHRSTACAEPAVLLAEKDCDSHSYTPASLTHTQGMPGMQRGWTCATPGGIGDGRTCCTAAAGKEHKSRSATCRQLRHAWRAAVTATAQLL
jgi:hypothetical protein